MNQGGNRKVSEAVLGSSTIHDGVHILTLNRQVQLIDTWSSYLGIAKWNKPPNIQRIGFFCFLWGLKKSLNSSEERKKEERKECRKVGRRGDGEESPSPAPGVMANPRADSTGNPGGA